MKIMLQFILLISFFSCKENKKHVQPNKKTTIISKTLKASTPDTISNNVFQNLEKYLKKHKDFNNRIAFYIDMKIPFERERFFILDVQNKVIKQKGFVAQGENTIHDKNGKLIFSNEVNSNCTSLGKYKIGEKYYGKFGKAFKLYGLEKSNSNAFKRAIVLHGYKEMPDLPQSNRIIYSKGCPMVSTNFFNLVEKIIDKSNESILLDIEY